MLHAKRTWVLGSPKCPQDPIYLLLGLHMDVALPGLGVDGPPSRGGSFSQLLLIRFWGVSPPAPRCPTVPWAGMTHSASVALLCIFPGVHITRLAPSHLSWGLITPSHLSWGLVTPSHLSWGPCHSSGPNGCWLRQWPRAPHRAPLFLAVSVVPALPKWELTGLVPWLPDAKGPWCGRRGRPGVDPLRVPGLTLYDPLWVPRAERCPGRIIGSLYV